MERLYGLQLSNMPKPTKKKTRAWMITFGNSHNMYIGVNPPVVKEIKYPISNGIELHQCYIEEVVNFPAIKK